MSTTPTLDDLLLQNRVWRGHQAIRPEVTNRRLPTGFDWLDNLLPEHGWPCAGVTEVVTSTFGIGEIRLLAPLLAQLSADPHYQLWVSPPFQLYAPALHQLGIRYENQLVVRSQNPDEHLWAMEQGLKSPACTLVMGWLPKCRPSQLRRLQLHASEQKTPCFVFSPVTALKRPSPGQLKLALMPPDTQGEAITTHHLRLQIIKCRGRWPMDGPEMYSLQPYALLTGEQFPDVLDDNLIVGPWEGASA